MDQRLITPYIQSAVNIIKEMTGIEVSEVGEAFTETSDLFSYGVTSVITFAGQIKGRLVLDIEPVLASKLMTELMGEAEPNLRDRVMLGCIAEINNIVAGDANTSLNNEYGLKLRLAPPIVMTGERMVLASSKVESVTAICKTVYGEFKLNIAFQGGLPA